VGYELLNRRVWAYFSENLLGRSDQCGAITRGCRRQVNVSVIG
jgi:hypothetical protein